MASLLFFLSTRISLHLSFMILLLRGVVHIGQAAALYAFGKWFVFSSKEGFPFCLVTHVIWDFVRCQESISGARFSFPNNLKSLENGCIRSDRARSARFLNMT